MKTRAEQIREHLAGRQHMIELKAVRECAGTIEEREAELAARMAVYGAMRGEGRFAFADGVAIIPILGVLSNDAWYRDTTYRQIRTAVQEALNDQEVKAILLVIDSPGGECDDAFETAAFLAQAATEKPIAAVADTMAYSAAYLLASQAARVWAPVTTGGVGSVGVYAAHVDYSEMLAKAGIKVTFISAGEGKTDGNPYEPLSESAQEELQTEVDRLYGEFVAAVARGRKLPESAVVKLGARLYEGSERSLAAKLIDAAGTWQDAFAALTGGQVPLNVSDPAEQPAEENDAEPEQDPGDEDEPPTEGTASAVGLSSGIVPAPGETPNADLASGAVSGNEQSAEGLALLADPAYVADVTELCRLSGLTGFAEIAREFQREQKPLAEVRRELQARRAKQDSEFSINSHVLPETTSDSARPATTATATEVANSPIVKAAEKEAQRAQRGKGKV